MLKGSLARGEGDERSDVDLVIVTRPGPLGELWADRRAIAERLGRWLGGFDEVAWQAPHTFIGFYDGPIKVDFFYQEAEPHADPWLRDGFVALVDPDGLADALKARLTGERGSPDLSHFDAHPGDWLWWMDVKLTRGGQAWLVYLELVMFVETMLLTGHNALSPEPWRGASGVEQRLPAEVRAELSAALPAAPEPEELRRAFDVALQRTCGFAGGSRPNGECRSPTTSPARCSTGSGPDRADPGDNLREARRRPRRPFPWHGGVPSGGGPLGPAFRERSSDAVALAMRE